MKSRSMPRYGANYLRQIVHNLSTNDNIKLDLTKLNKASGDVVTRHWSELPEDDEFYVYMKQKMEKGEGEKNDA